MDKGPRHLDKGGRVRVHSKVEGSIHYWCFFTPTPQGGAREKAKGTGLWSSLFQMGATSSSTILGSKQTPLVCILKNWKKFYPWTLLKKHMIFFFTEAWPQYDPSDGGRWPPEGSLNYNTILQLDLFCR